MDRLPLPRGVVRSSDVTVTYDLLARTPFLMGLLVATDQDLPAETLDPTALWIIVDTEDDRVVLQRGLRVKQGAVVGLDMYILASLMVAADEALA